MKKLPQPCESSHEWGAGSWEGGIETRTCARCGVVAEREFEMENLRVTRVGSWRLVERAT